VEHRRTLLCVHPHPDDESIACGGVLARASAGGDRTVVVTCTGGEEGENLAGIDLGGEDLITHRRRELADALAALQVEEHVWLGYRDSGMAGSAANDHPDCFHRADLDETALRLAAVLRRARPDVVVSDDVHGTYGHPDHVKAHHVTVRAVALAADPEAPLDGDPWQVPKRYVHTLTKSRLWAAHRGLTEAGLPSPFGDADVTSPDDLPMGTPDDAVTTVVDVTPWLPAKRAALVAHRSQIGADSFFLNTPEDLAASLFGTEEFVLEEGTPGAGAGGIEPDLFAGLAAVGADPAVEADEVDPVAQLDVAGDVDPDVEALRVDRRHVDESDFREVLGRFVTGVSVMTTLGGTEPHAMTASAVASVSLDPPLVLVCVDRTAVMADEVVRAGVFALTFLAEDQAALSHRFADPSRPPGAAQFAGVATEVALTGSPIVTGGAGWVDATVWKIHDGGDHLIVVGEVVALDQDPLRRPLAYHRGGYGRLAED
jgi:N-acetyl-1-D-myo-inositol-2-amino-2-deoxy-alpha-D-glucopyranoside deacetylase